MMLIRLSLLLSLLLTTTLLQASSGAHSAPWPQPLQPLGEGRFSRYFFDIYDARLFAASSSWPGQLQGALPVALELTYLRDIEAEDLVEATAEQWQQQPQWVDHPQQQQWLASLRQLWPDVRRGDQLAVVVDVEGLTHFYHNGSAIGVVSAPEFGRAFLDIWLSPHTSAPDLRAQLIGGEQP
ncbi:MAG: chalcone isomerase family protein [Gammaproteobacteria bacterium]|nr:chalcone isomerase family protein [Gammaproteobacteria bacterium]